MDECLIWIFEMPELIRWVQASSNQQAEESQPQISYNQ